MTGVGRDDGTRRGDVIPREVARILTSKGIGFTVRRRTAYTPWLTKSLLTRSRRGSAIAIAICAQGEKVDLCAIAHLLGWHRARLASPLEMLTFLGADQREVSPVAEDGPPVLIDAALAELDRVLVNAGTHDLYVEVSVPDLFRLTHGLCAPVVLHRSRWE
jgi:prolyl-tRNA editing enzyme YbaK/EbsC (Cys-tRNA(Pro) deacylase)